MRLHVAVILLSALVLASPTIQAEREEPSTPSSRIVVLLSLNSAFPAEAVPEAEQRVGAELRAMRLQVHLVAANEGTRARRHEELLQRARELDAVAGLWISRVGDHGVVHLWVGSHEQEVVIDRRYGLDDDVSGSVGHLSLAVGELLHASLLELRLSPDPPPVAPSHALERSNDELRALRTLRTLRTRSTTTTRVTQVPIDSLSDEESVANIPVTEPRVESVEIERRESLHDEQAESIEEPSGEFAEDQRVESVDQRSSESNDEGPLESMTAASRGLPAEEESTYQRNGRRRLNRQPRRFRIYGGATMPMSFNAFSVTAAGMVGAGGRVLEWLVIDLDAQASFIPIDVVGKPGTARVYLAAFRALTTFEPWPRALVRLGISFGGGLTVAYAFGDAVSGYADTTDSMTAGLLSAGLRFAIPISRRIRIVVATNVGVTFPDIPVRFSGQPYATFGRPILDGTLAIEWGIGDLFGRLANDS